MKIMLNSVNKKIAGEEKATSKLGACANASIRMPKNKKQQHVNAVMRV